MAGAEGTDNEGEETADNFNIAVECVKISNKCSHVDHSVLVDPIIPGQVNTNAYKNTVSSDSLNFDDKNISESIVIVDGKENESNRCSSKEKANLSMGNCINGNSYPNHQNGCTISTPEGMTALPKKKNCDEFVKMKKKKRRIHKDNNISKKQKKWTTWQLEETGFNLSLFPRQPVKISSREIDEHLNSILDCIDNDFCELENKIIKMKDFDLYESEEANVRRSDRDHKKTKARKQIKTKYCRSVKNNKGRKLYVHHRTYKLMDLEPRRYHFLSSTKSRNCVTSRNLEPVDIKRTKDRYNNIKPTPPVAAQNPLALHSNNIPSGIATDQGLVDLLISLQHRDLSPEDYDLLLRLDDQVAPKTLSEDTLKALRTEEICGDVREELCAICIELYCVGQRRKYLPCNHYFHENCIDMWLTNSSLNCPLDGLPVT